MAMKTLEELAVENLTLKDMKQAMEWYWISCNFKRYHKLVEARLTYWQMQQWTESLAWHHPIARWLDSKRVSTPEPCYHAAIRCMSLYIICSTKRRERCIAMNIKLNLSKYN